MSGDSPLAWPNMTSRHAQKSPPSARPRNARWKVCECALTKPGRLTDDDTPRSLLADELDACAAEQGLEVGDRLAVRVVRAQAAAVAEHGHGGALAGELDTLDLPRR